MSIEHDSIVSKLPGCSCFSNFGMHFVSKSDDARLSVVALHADLLLSPFACVCVVSLPLAFLLVRRSLSWMRRSSRSWLRTSASVQRGEQWQVAEPSCLLRPFEGPPVRRRILATPLQGGSIHIHLDVRYLRASTQTDPPFLLDYEEELKRTF